MRDWSKGGERRDGIRQIIAYLHDPANRSEREQCKTNRACAKQLIQTVGQFTNIPAQTEVRVYEKIEIPPRDEDLAVLVLPDPKLALPATGKIDVSQIYRCTWDPWASRARARKNEGAGKKRPNRASTGAAKGARNAGTKRARKTTK